MVGISNQNVFFIKKDASSFAEFEISEFEVSRVDCNTDQLTLSPPNLKMSLGTTFTFRIILAFRKQRKQ